jgi:hypothetical protein
MGKKDAAAEQAYNLAAIRTYQNMLRLWDMPGDMLYQDGLIYEIRIRKPKERGGETLVVIKAADGLKKWVAFHSGSDVNIALSGALARLASQTLKWREDQYAKQVPEAPDGGPLE